MDGNGGNCFSFRIVDMGRQYTLKTIATAIERYHCGESALSIAKDLGVRSSLVRDWYEKYYERKPITPMIMVLNSKTW